MFAPSHQLIEAAAVAVAHGVDTDLLHPPGVVVQLQHLPQGVLLVVRGCNAAIVIFLFTVIRLGQHFSQPAGYH